MAEGELEKALIQEIEMMTARDIARHQWDVLWAAVSEKTATKEERQKAQTQLHCARGRWNVAREADGKAKHAKDIAEERVHMHVAGDLLFPPERQHGTRRRRRPSGMAHVASLRWLCGKGPALHLCAAGNAGVVGAAVGGACQPDFGAAYIYVSFLVSASDCS